MREDGNVHLSSTFKKTNHLYKINTLTHTQLTHRSGVIALLDQEYHGGLILRDDGLRPRSPTSDHLVQCISKMSNVSHNI